VVAEQDISFNSSQLGASTTQFGAASTFTTGVNVARQLSRSQTVGVTEEFQRADLSGVTGIMQGLLGTWHQAIGRDVTVTAAAGMRLYTLQGRSGFQRAPGGSFGFTAHLRHDDSLGLRYERFVEQTLGNGTHLSDQVWAGYVLSLSRRLALDASANYGRGIFPLDPSQQLSGQTGTIAVRYTLAQNLAAVLGYARYVRTQTPIPAITGDRVTMSLSFGRKWR
jgi:hypothetical protein